MKRLAVFLVLSVLPVTLNISAASANPGELAEVIAEIEVDASEHGCDASYAARMGRYEEHATRRLYDALVAQAAEREWDEGFLVCALSAVAAAKGFGNVAEAVLEMTPEVAEEFMEWFFSR